MTKTAPTVSKEFLESERKRLGSPKYIDALREYNISPEDAKLLSGEPAPLKILIPGIKIEE
jgi:hypothetical protein